MSAELLLVLRLAVGLVFLWACLAKLRAARALISGLMSYDMIPEVFIRPFAVLLVLAEGFIAVSHLSGYLLSFASAIAVALLCGSVGVVLLVLKKGRTVRCVCFGADGEETISSKTLIRLLGLLCVETGFIAGQAFAEGAQHVSPIRAESLWLQMLCAAALIAVLAWVANIPTLLNAYTESVADRGSQRSRV